MLRKLLPSQVAWTSKDLWNVCVTARRYCDLLYSQEIFDSQVVPSLSVVHHAKDNLDNQTDDIIDPALQLSRDLFLETLK